MKTKKIISLLLAICLILTLQPLNTKFAYAVVNELNTALNVAGGTLSFVNDAVHPWIVDSTTDAGRTSAASNINGISYGSTSLTLNAGTLLQNKVLTFDWNVSSETDKDSLNFIVNGTPSTDLLPITGQTGTWSTYKFVVPSTGTYTFTWTYEKDGAVDSGADRGWIDNVKIGDFVHVESVVVSPAVSSCNISFTTQLTASVLPADATNQKIISWASDNTAIATVSSTGLVIGVAQGTAYIVATSAENGEILGEGRVNVQAPVATTGISLDYSQGTLLFDGTAGDSGYLVATITPALASYRTISWFTSAPAIVAITTAGKVTAKSVGTATITARSQTGSFTATCQITVVPNSSLQDQTHLTYTPITLGATTPMTLGWQSSSYIAYSRPPLMPFTSAKGFSVHLEAGKKIRFETGGSTTSVDTYLDIYDASFNRVVFDDDEGNMSYSLIESFVVPTTGIYYILVSGYSYSSKGSFNLYVNEVPPVPVTGVSFNQDTFSVPLTYTLPVPYSVLPGNADTKGVTFTSSNESSITVNTAGEVTGVNPGSSVITVTTVQGGFTDTCLVSVGYTPVASVSYETDAVIVGINYTKTLQYSIQPAAAQLRGVTFTSSNLSVATVSSLGIVKAVGLGNAVITVTTADGGHTDICSVMVVAVNISTCASVTLVAGDV
ncbi:MAG: Ig-like domain-containing protein, partial [Eubacteriales bacterium]